MTSQDYGVNYGGGTVPNAALGAAAGVLGLAGGLYDSHQNRKTARENTDKTIAANKAEAELAYQRSVEMWHMQNAYNSPQAQMERFKAGGLNPHLIYGQGNSGNASSPPNYQPPNMQHRYAAGSYGESIASILPTLMSVGTWMQNMKMSEVEINKRSTETERAELLMQVLKEKYPREIEKINQQIDLLGYQGSAVREVTRKTQSQVADSMMQFKYDWGRELELPDFDFDYGKGSGVKDLQRKSLEEKIRQQKADVFIKSLLGKLKEAETSFIDDFGFGGTPLFMQLVAGSALKLAGIQTRMSRPKPQVNKKLSRTITNYEKGGRRVVKRNIYE